MKHVFHHFADATRARPDALRRLEQRLEAEVADPERVREILAHAPSARPGAEGRVLHRLAARLRHPAVPHSRVRPVFAVALATAALVMWAVRAVPLPLAGSLSAPEWKTANPTAQVALNFQGEGTLGGTNAAPDIDWRAGTLKVEVEPNKGIKLAVKTREAVVRVVGTGFSVDRGALGTTVEVTHGRVSVECAAPAGGTGESVMLGAGERHVCLPTTPAALLGRARALSASHASPADVLATVDRGLTASPTGSVREELQVARMESLAAAGRWDDALSTATSALAGVEAEPGVTGRAADILHLRAGYALRAKGCAAAAPGLAALSNAGMASAPELVSLADCYAPSQPERARQALRQALELGVPIDQQPGVEERLARLGSEP